MNKYHFLSLISFIIGVVFFILGFLQGDLQTGIFLIFPFIAGSGVYAFIGFIFIFISILLFISGFSVPTDLDKINLDKENSGSGKKISVKGGGVVLIGPFPIVFGSNWKIAAFLMVLAIILILVVLFVFLLI